MPESNPYATPEANLLNETTDSIGINAIKQFPRFTTWAVVGLAIITMGLYGYYWLYTRTKKLNTLIPENPIASWLPPVTIVAVVVYWVMSLMPLLPLITGNTAGMGSMGVGLLQFAWVLNILVIVLFLTWVFGFRNRINQITGVKKGNMFWLGGIITFFFNLYYFQYKINQMHDKG